MSKLIDRDTRTLRHSHSLASSHTLLRLLASMVIRRGISENVSELSQLTILKELTTACSISIGGCTG